MRKQAKHKLSMIVLYEKPSKTLAVHDCVVWETKQTTSCSWLCCMRKQAKHKLSMIVLYEKTSQTLVVYDCVV